MWKQHTSEAWQENTELNFEQICEDDRVRVEKRTVEESQGRNVETRDGSIKA